MAPSVCVALAVKDGKTCVSQAIESVLRQEGADVELRVVDNGSSDGSVAIAQRYAAADTRVLVEINPFDVGYYGSLNRALAATECELFVPFACDDLMLPGNLARKVEALAATGADVVHSSTYTIDESGTATALSPDHREVPPLLDAPGFFTVIAARNLVIPAAVVARSDALRAIGGFDARPVYCSDWLAWLRLALRFRWATLAEPLVAYRVHGESGSTRLHRAGAHGRDVPATLHHVFSDEAVPAAWASWRDTLVAVATRDIGLSLHAKGLRRVEQGFAGYMLMGRALARRPDDPQLQAGYPPLVE